MQGGIYAHGTVDTPASRHVFSRRHGHTSAKQRREEEPESNAERDPICPGATESEAERGCQTTQPAVNQARGPYSSRWSSRGSPCPRFSEPPLPLTLVAAEATEHCTANAWLGERFANARVTVPSSVPQCAKRCRSAGNGLAVWPSTSATCCRSNGQHSPWAV